MKNNAKKILSILTALVMLLPIMSIGAFASDVTISVNVDCTCTHAISVADTTISLNHGVKVSELIGHFTASDSSEIKVVGAGNWSVPADYFVTSSMKLVAGATEYTISVADYEWWSSLPMVNATAFNSGTSSNAVLELIAGEDTVLTSNTITNKSKNGFILPNWAPDASTYATEIYGAAGNEISINKDGVSGAVDANTSMLIERQNINDVNGVYFGLNGKGKIISYSRTATTAKVPTTIAATQTSSTGLKTVEQFSVIPKCDKNIVRFAIDHEWYNPDKSSRVASTQAYYTSSSRKDRLTDCLMFAEDGGIYWGAQFDSTFTEDGKLQFGVSSSGTVTQYEYAETVKVGTWEKNQKYDIRIERDRQIKKDSKAIVYINGEKKGEFTRTNDNTRYVYSAVISLEGKNATNVDNQGFWFTDYSFSVTDNPEVPFVAADEMTATTESDIEIFEDDKLIEKCSMKNFGTDKTVEVFKAEIDSPEYTGIEVYNADNTIASDNTVITAGMYARIYAYNTAEVYKDYYFSDATDNGIFAAAVSGDTLTVSRNIKKYNNTPEDRALIAVLYDSTGKMVTAVPDKKDDITTTTLLSTPIDVTGLDGTYYVKAMLWDGFERLVPLCEAVQVSVTDGTITGTQSATNQ